MNDPDAARRRSSRLRATPVALVVLAILVVLSGCDTSGRTGPAASTAPSSATVALPSAASSADGAAPSLVSPWSPTPGAPSDAAPPGSLPIPTGPTTSPDRSASPSPPPASPSGTPSPVTPAPGPFGMDLYHAGAFVTETNKVMCVAAAMQVMVNIMSGVDDATPATQRRLYALARKLSPATLKGDGAEPEGWARGLEELGHGRYVVRALPTMKAAIQAAAKAVRTTARPAGLLVWYGAHSWVMSGFRSTADPSFTDRFVVTDVSIEDVWYPKVSTIWGRSRPPDSLVPVARLPRDFLPWRMPGGPYPDKAWKYVVVLPVS